MTAPAPPPRVQAPRAAPVLELRGVAKHFGGVRALDGVDLVVGRGAVHGLLGQNGSGKSTLLNVLAGYHAPDAGTLTVRGRWVQLPLAPGGFRELGLAFVHQDLALIGALTVTENLAAGRLAPGGERRISWRRERRRATEILHRYGLASIDVTAPVARLAPMQRALLAIVRAVEELRESHREAPLLVLDEPTAFLPREGVDRLFALIRGLVAEGASVLLVTHDLDEVREVCDRATVLRDGRVAGSVDVAATSEGELVELIVGHRLEERRRSRARARVHRSDAVRVRELSGPTLVGLDLDLHPGEVLGVTGLLGSGFEEVPQLLFGAAPGTGTIHLDGAVLDVDRLTPRRAMGMGIALVPADRAAEATIAGLSVTDNVTMTTLDRYGGRARLSRPGMHRAARELGARYGIRPNAPRMPLGALSGGNQQRAVLAKWLQSRPALLLLAEPTQGVDVGAREHIFEAIRSAAREGAAVLCASADDDQLAAVCDRLVIVARGKAVLELTGTELTKERIAEQVLTSVSADAVLDPAAAVDEAGARAGVHKLAGGGADEERA